MEKTISVEIEICKMLSTTDWPEFKCPHCHEKILTDSVKLTEEHTVIAEASGEFWGDGKPDDFSVHVELDEEPIQVFEAVPSPTVKGFSVRGRKLAEWEYDEDEVADLFYDEACVKVEDVYGDEIRSELLEDAADRRADERAAGKIGH